MLQVQLEQGQHALGASDSDRSKEKSGDQKVMTENFPVDYELCHFCVFNILTDYVKIYCRHFGGLLRIVRRQEKAVSERRYSYFFLIMIKGMSNCEKLLLSIQNMSYLTSGCG